MEAQRIVTRALTGLALVFVSALMGFDPNLLAAMVGGSLLLRRKKEGARLGPPPLP